MKNEKKKTNKIVMIVAPEGYRQEELEVPKEIFEKMGIQVVVASSTLETAKGYPNSSVQPEIMLKDVKPYQYDAVIFVGGSGASCYWDDATAHSIAADTVNGGQVLGAICIAPVILARSGVVNGLKVTVWPSEAQEIRKANAIYIKSPEGVVVDHNIVTADGPQSASAFALAVIAKIRE